jgi:type VI protein secretion system component Hcp
LDFYVVMLEDVIVTHAGQCATTDVQAPLKFETLAKSPAGAALLEEVTLHFAKIRWNTAGSDRRERGSRQSSAAGM